GPDRVSAIVGLFERRTYPPDTMIVREGEPGDALYIVETGLVAVTLVPDNGEVNVLTRLGPGEAFGEMAVLTGEPRSAGVRSVSPTTVRVVERERFLRAAAETPLLLFNLSRVLVSRLSRANRAASKLRGSEGIGVIRGLAPVVRRLG